MARTWAVASSTDRCWNERSDSQVRALRGHVDGPEQRQLVAVDGGELGGEARADLGPHGLAPDGHHLLQHGRERLLQQRGPPHARGELVDGGPPGEEGVEPAVERALVDERRQGRR